MKVLLGLVVVVGICLFPGCEDLPCNKSVDQSKLDAVDKTQLDKDIALIDAQLFKEGIVAVKDPSGIRYVVREPGFGGTPCLENQLTVVYTGKFLESGKEFNSGNTQFQLKNLILGWQIILPLFPKGAKVTLYIPSGYAYGTAGQPSAKSGHPYQCEPRI